ncbi:MAG: XRE family transcriptional regulator [Candidatus Omnitrophota bacterium]|nr:XRE family transcriptional regulator [Candidatus Omnitrophota bacterium]
MKIGKVIKGLRTKMKMTQAELAKRAGLDFTTISKVEKGSLTGTLNTHRKIAAALGISLVDLYKELDGPGRPAFEVSASKKDQADIFHYNKRAVSQILLGRVLEHKMLPELLALEKNGTTRLEQKRPGTEQFIFVLEGNIEIKIAAEVLKLKKGQSVYFDASRPHIIRNTTKTPAKCLRVTSPGIL